MAATIIDSLVVTLGLDGKGLTTGAQKADTELKRLQSEADKTGEAFKRQSALAVSAFKEQQEAAAKAFKEQQSAAVRAGTITESEARRAFREFKSRQIQEAAAFKKGQTEKAVAFKKGQAAQIKGTKEQIAQDKQQAESLSKVRNELLGILAAYVGFRALGTMGKQTIEADTSVERKSQVLGVDPATLNAWEMALRKIGVSAGEVEDAFRTTNQIQQQIAQGSQEVISKFTEFAKVVATQAPGVHVDTAKLLNRRLTSEQRLMELSKIAQQMSVKDAALALAKLGYSEDIARALHEGNISLAASLQHARALDPQFRQAAETSNQISMQWAELENRFKGVKDTILTKLGPAIEWILSQLEKLGAYGARHIGEVEAAVGALGLAFGALSAKSIAGAILKIGELTGGLGTATTALGKLAAGLGNAGLWAAGIVTAGLIGWKMGEELSDHFSQATKEKIGKSIAEVLAFFGNKDAKEALALNTRANVAGRTSSGRISSGRISSGHAAQVRTGGVSAVDVAQLESMGWSYAQAVGIVANIQRESSGNIKEPGDNGQAYGLAQWHPDRQAAFAKWAGHGIHQSTRQEQLGFINYELRHGEAGAGARLARAKTAEDAAAIVAQYYERPANPKEYGIRAGIAARLAGMFKGAPVDHSIAAGAPAALAANNMTTSTTTNSASTQVAVNGPINIHTQASDSDAPGIAKGIAKALQIYTFASNANQGLT